MTEHHENEPVQDEMNEDSTTDVIASIAAILIAVVFMIYWISNQ